MNLHTLLRNRAADGEPIRVGVIGAGKFGTMFLAQARTTPVYTWPRSPIWPSPRLAGP